MDLHQARAAEKPADFRRGWLRSGQSLLQGEGDRRGSVGVGSGRPEGGVGGVGLATDILSPAGGVWTGEAPVGFLVENAQRGLGLCLAPARGLGLPPRHVVKSPAVARAILRNCQPSNVCFVSSSGVGKSSPDTHTKYPRFTVRRTRSVRGSYSLAACVPALACQCGWSLERLPRRESGEGTEVIPSLLDGPFLHPLHAPIKMSL